MAIWDKIKTLNESIDQDSEYVPQLPQQEQPKTKWSKWEKFRVAMLVSDKTLNTLYTLARLGVLVLFLVLGTKILHGEMDPIFTDAELQGFFLMMMGVVFFVVLEKKKG